MRCRHIEKVIAEIKSISDLCSANVVSKQCPGETLKCNLQLYSLGCRTCGLRGVKALSKCWVLQGCAEKDGYQRRMFSPVSPTKAPAAASGASGWASSHLFLAHNSAPSAPTLGA